MIFFDRVCYSSGEWVEEGDLVQLDYIEYGSMPYLTIGELGIVSKVVWNGGAARPLIAVQWFSQIDGSMMYDREISLVRRNGKGLMTWI